MINHLFLHFNHRSFFYTNKNQNEKDGVITKRISFFQKDKLFDIALSMKKNFLLSEVISDFGIEVRKKNNSKVILCPFHKEKTASFFFDDSKGIFKCFGCGISGNTIGFIKKMKEINNIEQKRYTKILKNGFDSDKKIRNTTYQRIDDKRLFSDLISLKILLCIQIALGFYIQKSKTKSMSKNIIELRGMSSFVEKIFGIGYSLGSSNELVVYFKKFGLSYKEMVETGLVIKKRNLFEKKEIFYSDIFQSRLIIPIKNHYNVVIGFGGRLVKNSKQPKYINSSDSNFFKKNRLLFQNYIISQSLLKKPRIKLITEGYLDCVSLFQNGIRSSTSSLGTSVNYFQVKLTSFFSTNKHVVFCFDSDSPGKLAFSNFFSNNSEFIFDDDLYVSSLDYSSSLNEKDPDEIVYYKGSSYFVKNFLNNSLPGLEIMNVNIEQENAFSIKNFKQLLTKISIIFQKNFFKRNNIIFEKKLVLYLPLNFNKVIIKNLPYIFPDYQKEKKRFRVERKDFEFEKEMGSKNYKYLLYLALHFECFKEDFVQDLGTDSKVFSGFTLFKSQIKMNYSIFKENPGTYKIYKQKDFLENKFLILNPVYFIPIHNQYFGAKRIGDAIFNNNWNKEMDILILNLMNYRNTNKNKIIKLEFEKLCFLRLITKHYLIKCNKINHFTEAYDIINFYNSRIREIVRILYLEKNISLNK
jgi:DNA primase catalytic core